ncbi:MAG: triose-phosphate isomerase, partial [Proteobacteria bacterium]|nr:triose-phosphate isomerase [Pseudomonadota bacterium]
MNGSLESAKSLVIGIKQGLAGSNNAEVAICPPFVYLPEISGLLGDT